MGLDMSIRKMERSIWNTILHEDLWKVKLEESEQLIYWRKEYWLQSWFKENLAILEESSEEITGVKLAELFLYIRSQNRNDVMEDLWMATFNIDNEKYVLFYTESN